MNPDDLIVMPCPGTGTVQFAEHPRATHPLVGSAIDREMARRDALATLKRIEADPSARAPLFSYLTAEQAALLAPND